MVVDQRAPDPEHPPLGIERHLHVPELVAFLGGGGEMLAAILDPLDRAADDPGGERDHGLLGVEDEFGPEPAADIGSDHAQPVLGATQQVGKHRVRAMRHLGAAPDREPAVIGIETGEHPPALDRVSQPLVLVHRGADDMARLGEGPIAVAIGH